MQRIKVTIIIPMRNEERYIGRCIDTILANDFPMEDCEILVIDGCSTDKSREIVAQKALHCSCIRLLDNPKKIVPVALNGAIREARGEFIIRMDAHAEYPPDYIRCCIYELESGSAEVVGGCITTCPGGDSLTANAIALMTQHPFGVGNSAFRLGWSNRYVDTVPFGAFRKDLFERIGLFHEKLITYQDFEFNARVRAAGGRVFLSPRIRLTYYNVANFASFMQQGFRKGRGVVRGWLYSPVSFRWRHAVPLAFVTALGLSFAVGLVFRPALILAALIFSTYAILASLASAHLAWLHGIRYLCVLPVLFLAYHSVYGAGSIVALACSLQYHGVSVLSRRKRTPQPATDSAAPNRAQT